MPLQRYSVYDHMDRKGVFATNPANPDSRDSQGQSLYKGPVGFPKMLYHPKGEEKEISPAHLEFDRGREFTIPAKYEMITRIVETPADAKKLLASGWWDHPAKAIEAGNRVRAAAGLPLRPVPEMNSAELATREAMERAEEEIENRDIELADAKKEIERLQAQLASKSK